MTGLATIQHVNRVRRLAGNARQARDRIARKLRPDQLARKLPPLMRWIPRISRHLTEPTHLAPLVEQLERVLRGEAIEVCVSVPPRHGKTTTIVHWIVWLLIQRPAMRILYCSFGAGMARKQSRAIRTLALRAGLAMGELRQVSEWTTAAGGGLKVCGIHGAPTGDGFDVIIVDDPIKSRREAESAGVRDSVNTAYGDDIYTRQQPDTPEQPSGTSHVVVHTRWHEDDLIGSLTRHVPDGPEPYTLVNLPAIRADGSALAPSMWPLAKLRRFERRLGPHAWWSLYMGSPRPKGGALFGAIVWVDRAPAAASHHGGVDIARTAKRRSDHQAAVVVAREPGEMGLIYVVDVEYEQELLVDRTLDDGAVEHGFNRRLHAQQMRWRCQHRLYAGGTETTIGDTLARDHEFPVLLRIEKAASDKWERAQPTHGKWSRVRVLRTVKHAEELARQVANFTGLDGAKDDLIDALVAACDEAEIGPVHAEAITPAAMRARQRPVATAMARSRSRWT